MEEMKELSNVLEYTDFEDEQPSPKGRWHSDIFKNKNPIVLELACGKGEYSIGLAELEPGKNYIGIDIKGNRMWVGATTALEKGLDNVRYFRAFIDHLPRYFEKGDVSEAWIIFPDPYIKKERKRLTSPKFLKTFREVMEPDTVINLKTDSELLYEYTREVIEEQNLELLEDIPNVYQTHSDHPKLSIQTYYEGMHLEKGKTIRFLSFRLGSSPENE